jgi:hypothetical protein
MVMQRGRWRRFSVPQCLCPESGIPLQENSRDESLPFLVAVTGLIGGGIFLKPSDLIRQFVAQNGSWRGELYRSTLILKLGGIDDVVTNAVWHLLKSVGVGNYSCQFDGFSDPGKGSQFVANGGQVYSALRNGINGGWDFRNYERPVGERQFRFNNISICGNRNSVN